ncbi:flagellar hook-length control protein FliK [Planococcus sp. CP5-4]|uniref:flagellar hook-length control protein FliK n=1 Tax=unclassified Planococcus (in: firmicutes) TaxID=2662419 RepID=UPI001C220E4C|nr:flagellar hook-length control protein FliK [Planococcus sp. CP5-4]MBU9672597.1 flagellar hook-length control protein FliK [Planococcus sp. CP5-4_YE]MBV0909647.1 flagellar hook-length control protein FliK [Planococcus sp. CP5-4_UN]MBW6064377.1 flagellar hook-length control protein FliK [Planococcus sp. CP5-4]
MNALVSALTGRPAAPAAAVKTPASNEPAGQFGQLLMALSADSTQPQAEPEAALEELPLKELTALLEQLSGMPVEQLTEEQQALQYAVFQLLADLNGEQLKQAIEAFSSDEEVQGELTALVKQIKSLLLTAKEFAQPAGFSGVAEKEIATAKAAPEEALRPLIELAAQLKEETLPSEKLLLLKELTPIITEARLPFAQTPAAWLHALSKESTQANSAIEQQAPDTQAAKAVPAEGEVIPKAEAVQPAAPVKTEGQTQAAVLPAAFADQKPVDVPVRQVPVQKLAETLAEWISSPARLSAGGNETRLRINIFPEHLGHLEILVSTAGGKVSAQIIASHGAAKEAVEFQLNQLRMSLSQQGVEIDRLEVREERSSSEFQQHERQREAPFSNAPGNKVNQRSGSGGESVSDDAEIAPKRQREAVSMNGQVDYSV